MNMNFPILIIFNIQELEQYSVGLSCFFYKTVFGHIGYKVTLIFDLSFEKKIPPMPTWLVQKDSFSSPETTCTDSTLIKENNILNFLCQCNTHCLFYEYFCPVEAEKMIPEMNIQEVKFD